MHVVPKKRLAPCKPRLNGVRYPLHFVYNLNIQVTSVMKLVAALVSIPLWHIIFEVTTDKGHQATLEKQSTTTNDRNTCYLIFQSEDLYLYPQGYCRDYLCQQKTPSKNKRSHWHRQESMAKRSESLLSDRLRYERAHVAARKPTVHSPITSAGLPSCVRAECCVIASRVLSGRCALRPCLAMPCLVHALGVRKN